VTVPPDELLQKLLHDDYRVDSIDYLLLLFFRVLGIVAAGCFLGLAVYLAILLHFGGR
jgi:hypothetical protein